MATLILSEDLPSRIFSMSRLIFLDLTGYSYLDVFLKAGFRSLVEVLDGKVFIRKLSSLLTSMFKLELAL